MNAKFKRGFKIATIVICVVGVVAVPFVVRSMNNRRDHEMTVSCANHANQLNLLIRMFGEGNEHFPSEKDTRAAFLKMSDSDASRSNWLYSIGAACPESFKRDRSIGYVFVGDGLPTQALNERPSLMFFCPAGSHQRSTQHCHAGLTDGLRCVESNAEMIKLLRVELGRAKEGSVPYSPNAQMLIERELGAREKRVK